MATEVEPVVKATTRTRRATSRAAPSTSKGKSRKSNTPEDDEIAEELSQSEDMPSPPKRSRKQLGNELHDDADSDDAEGAARHPGGAGRDAAQGVSAIEEGGRRGRSHRGHGPRGVRPRPTEWGRCAGRPRGGGHARARGVGQWSGGGGAVLVTECFDPGDRAVQREGEVAVVHLLRRAPEALRRGVCWLFEATSPGAFSHRSHQ